MLALLLYLSALQVAPATEPLTLTRAQMQADLAQLAAEVRANWSYGDDKREHFGIDADARLAELAAELPESAALDEFALELRRCVAALGDGHAHLEVPGTAPAAQRRWPMTLLAVVEGVAVERVADAIAPTLADSPLPRPGDRLLSADGRPIERLWAAARDQSFGSTPGMRSRGALERLVGTHARAVAFEFERPDGSRFDVDLATVAADAAGLRKPSESAWSVDEPSPGLLRLRIANFAMSDWQGWLEAEQAARDVLAAEQAVQIDALFVALAARQPRALLLDLRGNGGGTDVIGIQFARHLLPGEFVYFKLSAQVDGTWTEPHGYVHGGEAELVRLACPIVALIDEGCFSTTDNFLRALDAQHPDFTSVGRPTGAGTGAPRVISELVHSGARLSLCTQRVYGPDDVLIEGRGTLPDVAVTWSRDDLFAGGDPDLEVALALLRERGLAPQ